MGSIMHRPRTREPAADPTVATGTHPRLCTPVVSLAQGSGGYVTITATLCWTGASTDDTLDAEATGRLLFCSCIDELRRLGLKEDAVLRTRIRMTDPAFWPILAAIRHEMMARSRAINLFEVDCDDSRDSHLIAEFDMAQAAA